MGGRAGRQYTFFMFSARTSYSSKTSCSRGESSGGSESVFIVDSIADGPAPSLVFSYVVRGGGSVEGSDASRFNDPAIFERRAGLDWAGAGRVPHRRTVRIVIYTVYLEV